MTTLPTTTLNIMEIDMTHKEEMLERRIRQRTRKRGFTPVPNAKIDARIQATESLLTVAYNKTPGLPTPTAATIQAEARREVARTLPAIPIGVRTRQFVNTSKYNQENTRGNR